ncbi:HAMP domain-containing methyl-accepting chemotaxis protein [Terasakiella sp. SH-1]|uniref:methyl-accepting chemotaxis protein n=1 Tax=Terasakiella sp. SH-1 TaxID=2560057 RepID=UPI0014307B2D|nr:HAMP domain-containing methyl-accepting chemotaxis protein [Terasakiella sp. SH-1]
MSFLKNTLAGQTVLPVIALSVFVVLGLGWQQSSWNNDSLMENLEKNRKSYETVLSLDVESRLNLMGEMGLDLIARDKGATKNFMAKEFDPIDFSDSHAKPTFNNLNQRFGGNMKHLVYCDGQSLTVKFVEPVDNTNVKLGSSCDSPEVTKAIAGYLKKGKTAEPLEGFFVVNNDVVLSRYFPVTKYSRKARGRVLQYLVRIDATLTPTLKAIQNIGSLETANIEITRNAKEEIQLDSKTALVSMKLPILDLNGSSIGNFELSKNVQDTLDNSQSTLMRSLTLLATALVIMCGLIILALKSRAITPIEKLTLAANEMSNGHLDTPIPYSERADEIGRLGHSLEIFRTNETDRRTLQQEQETQKAKAEEERKASIEKLANELEQNVGNAAQIVKTTASDLEEIAAQVSSTSTQANEASGVVSQKSEHTTQAVNATAAAVEELSASNIEIASLVERSNMVVNRASTTSDEAQDRVSSLQQTVVRISEVTDLITGIAEQTNLLALNATIEAARAGEAGKGFAVVASEVKNLANQTSRATDEITNQINAVQSATENSVQAIQEISTVVAEVQEIANSIAASIQQQSSATDEISASMQQAATDTVEVNQIVGEMGHATHQSGTAASQAQKAVEQLQLESGNLQTALNVFLSGMRQ